MARTWKFIDRKRKCGHSTFSPSEDCANCQNCNLTVSSRKSVKREIVRAKEARNKIPEYLIKFLVT